MYFVITNHDGEPKIDCLSRETLMKRLNEKYYGPIKFESEDWLLDHGMEQLGGAVLIKGEIVVPTAKETVVEFDVP